MRLRNQALHPTRGREMDNQRGNDSTIPTALLHRPGSRTVVIWTHHPFSCESHISSRELWTHGQGARLRNSRARYKQDTGSF